MTSTFSTHFRFEIPDFLSEPWHQAIQETIQNIDTAIFNAYIANIASAWVNSHVYTPGTIVYDPVDGSLWRDAIGHTSAIAPTTMATDRAAHPTFWSSVLPSGIAPVANFFVDSIDNTGIAHSSQPSFLGLLDIETGVPPGTYGGNFAPSFTIDQYGRLTNAIAGLTVAAPPGTIGTGQIPILLTAGNITWQGSPRERLNAPRTYFVRVDGSDANTGLVDSAGGAFLTIQKALNVAAGIDLNANAITIQVRSGTYTGQLVPLSLTGAGTVTVVGDLVTPSNCFIDVTSGFGWLQADTRGNYILRGFKIRTNTGGFSCIAVSGVSRLSFDNIEFSTSGNAHISCTSGSYVIGQGNYSITGNAVFHWAVTSQGVVSVAGKTITLVGTPAFSVAFAFATQVSVLIINGDTFAGTGATGQRYLADSNSVIDTGNAPGTAPNYIPGGSAGAVATGAQYIG